MSADNGIYIGRWLNPDGTEEFRVCHGFESSMTDLDRKDGPNAPPKEWREAMMVYSWGNCPKESNVDDLANEINRLDREYEWTEYGLCRIDFDHPFPTMNKHEAKKILDDYWKALSEFSEFHSPDPFEA